MNEAGEVREARRLRGGEPRVLNVSSDRAGRGGREKRDSPLKGAKACNWAGAGAEPWREAGRPCRRSLEGLGHPSQETLSNPTSYSPLQHVLLNAQEMFGAGTYVHTYTEPSASSLSSLPALQNKHTLKLTVNGKWRKLDIKYT